MAKKFLVDISTFQRNIDYAKLAKAVDGVIIRAGFRGYGSSGRLETDELFKIHITNCILHGIPVGVYWFAQEVNASEGKEAADYVYNLIKDYKITFPVYYDSEYSSSLTRTGRADNISKTERTNATVAFCEQIKKYGYIPGVYASESWFNDKLDFSGIKKFSIWVACYGADTGKAGRKPTTSVYDMWQYSSKGKVNGYNGNIDVNYCYKNFASSKKAYTGTFPSVKVTYYKTNSKGKKVKKTRYYLKQGDTGTQVKLLQEFLNWFGGYDLDVDGDYGPKTAKAVADFRKKTKLTKTKLTKIDTFGKGCLAKAKTIKK